MKIKSGAEYYVTLWYKKRDVILMSLFITI